MTAPRSDAEIAALIAKLGGIDTERAQAIRDGLKQAGVIPVASRGELARMDPPAEPLPIELVKELAMDIGKDIAHHIDTMYPKAVEAAGSTFLLSVRNTAYNQIMALMDQSLSSATVRERIDRHVRHRRQINRLRKLDPSQPMDQIIATIRGVDLAGER